LTMLVLLLLVLLLLLLAVLPTLLRSGDSMPANLLADGHEMKDWLLLLLLLLLVRVIAAFAAVLLPCPAAAGPLELLCCILVLGLAAS
jgi:hypothetical protein